MQVKEFSDGGRVAYRVKSIADSRCSFNVWYKSNGHVADAERIDSLGRAYPVTSRAQLRALHLRGGAIFAVTPQ